MKPENVVFTTDALNSHHKPEDMQVKVIDLGMAMSHDPKHPIKGKLNMQIVLHPAYLSGSCCGYLCHPGSCLMSCVQVLVRLLLPTVVTCHNTCHFLVQVFQRLWSAYVAEALTATNSTSLAC